MTIICCFGKAKEPGKPKESKKRKKRHSQASTKGSEHNSDFFSSNGVVFFDALSHYTSPRARSVASENEDNFVDCMENFYTADGIQLSPRPSLVTQESSEKLKVVAIPEASHSWDQAAAASPSGTHGVPGGASESSDGPSSLSGTDGIKNKFVGCLSILDNLRILNDEEEPKKKPMKSTSQKHKMDAGISFPLRPSTISPADAREMWEPCNAEAFMVRGLDYMRTKVKIPSTAPLYTCIGMDFISTDTRQDHIAKLINLPSAPQPKHRLSHDCFIPPLLIVNIQVPTYQASIWGSSDGNGHNIIFYFVLPEDFDPKTAPNQAAMGLLKRFIQNGREADGSPTRDRLKLIPRIINVDEWMVKGPLTNPEHRLLTNYNAKPILTRPQQTFHVGPNYLEVDIDIHKYAYLARMALQSYMTRIKEIIWECGLVLQGNGVDELPEQLLGCARIFRHDLTKFRPLGDFIGRDKNGLDSVQEQPDA